MCPGCKKSQPSTWPNQQIILSENKGCDATNLQGFCKTTSRVRSNCMVPWLKKDIDALEKIQHRATRRMSDIHGTYPERLQQLELTTLEERRSRGDAIEVFKYLRGFLDVEKETIFTTNISAQPRTRHQKSFMPLTVPRAKLDLRKNFFTIRGAKAWNCLPSEVRNSNTVNRFKKAYDKFMAPS